MFCPDCGNKLQTNDKFCDKCGASLYSLAVSSKPLKVKTAIVKLNDLCDNCGHELEKNSKFCENCGKKVGSKNKEAPASPAFYQVETPIQNAASGSGTKKNKLPWVVGGVIILIIIGSAVYQSSQNKQRILRDQLESQQHKADLLSNQLKTVQKENKQTTIDNSQSVVNVVCDNGDGGSGTIFSTDGWVLTNYHVIKGATFCAVTLPDPTTGAPINIYKAEPLSVPALSKEYDIAMLNINSSYTDSDGETWGDYPTIFPAFTNPEICDSTTSKLGDIVKIYGYPVTSGGYNLTVTDGIISSFDDAGNILTSAKIDSGNSGGLAIDQNGCFLGIPSAVIEGKYQNLGVIIAKSIIGDFLDKMEAQ